MVHFKRLLEQSL